MSSKLWIYHFPAWKVKDYMFSFFTPRMPGVQTVLASRLKGNKGGFTLLIDPERKAMAVSICSPKDQYSRKAGVAKAKQMLDLTDPMTNHILVPEVKSRCAMALRDLAVWTAFEQHMRHGWPVDKFQVNVMLAIGKIGEHPPLA